MTGETKLYKLYVVDMSHGRAVLEAPSAGTARQRALTRYGTVANPKVKLATQDDLQNQLRGGAVFFEGYWEVMERDRAFELANMPAPAERVPPTKGRFIEAYCRAYAKKHGLAEDSDAMNAVSLLMTMKMDGKVPWDGNPPWQDPVMRDAWRAVGGSAHLTVATLRALPD